MDKQSNYILEDLPKQKLSRSKKTKNWGKSCIDELEKVTYSDISYNGRSSRHRKQINYDLYNGTLDQKDFEYVINPYGYNKDEFPANLQHYDIISPKIQLLMGEEIKRPFNFKVITHDPDAISEMERKKKEMMLQFLYDMIIPKEQQQQMAEERAKMEQVDPERAKMMEIPTPDQVEKYMKYDYQDIREMQGQSILEYLVKQQSIESKFNAGFKDALVAGEEIYWVGEVSGEPVVRLCNPLDIRVILDPDSPHIEDAQSIIEERWLTLSTVIDEFHDDLTPREIDALEKGYSGRDSHMDNNGLNYPYSEFNIINYDARGTFDPDAIRSYRKDGMIRVIQCEWKSMRKVGFIKMVDEQGQINEDIVDEIFEIPDNAVKNKDTGEWEFDGVTLKWHWISEYWEGTKIAEDIYVNIRPKENQRRDMDNPSIVKSGYVGYIYNERNSESISLIDRMKPYQYLYNIVYYRTELALAKSKGKVALMDVAQIPSSEGWDVSKWMYYLEALGVMFINSREEGNRSQQAAPFNQFQSIDLSMGNYINTHVQLLEQIKVEVGELSGVSRQRQGQVQTSELVGNTERAVVQSSHITEYWFYNHGEVKKRVLQALVDVAKMAWRSGKKLQYIMDDMTRSFMNIEADTFSETNYGVFVSNSSKDDRNVESMKQLAQAALQSGSIGFSDVADVLTTESMAKMRTKLKTSQEEQKQREEQLQQQAQQMQQQQAEAQAQLEREKEDREDARKQLDSDTKIRVAEIAAEARMADADHNNDGYVDNTDRSEVARLDAANRDRAAREKNQADLQLKREELAEKKRANRANESIKKTAAKTKKANESNKKK
tara:strand:- start:1548 stop:4040 length:2493 start_codon:yes stop_codon:yes gene_type:complete